MKTHVKIMLALMCTLPAVPLSAFAQQNTRIPWSALSGGFGMVSAANTQVVSDIGQSFVGSSEVSNTFVESGFLVHPFMRGPLVGIPGEELLPSVYALYQNFPNPFNPSTTMRYELPQRSKVEVHLYNVIGQHVATLVNEEQNAGRYTIVWDGHNGQGSQIASGVYFYRLIARDVSSSAEKTFVETKKLILLR